MSAMTSQITSLTIVYSTAYSGADRKNHQRSASPAFVMGIHRWPVNSPYKGLVTRKMFAFDDVIMHTTWWHKPPQDKSEEIHVYILWDVLWTQNWYLRPDRCKCSLTDHSITELNQSEWIPVICCRIYVEPLKRILVTKGIYMTIYLANISDNNLQQTVNLELNIQDNIHRNLDDRIMHYDKCVGCRPIVHTASW